MMWTWRIGETLALMWSLSLSVSLLLLATGLFGTFISLYALQVGFSQTLAGLLMSAYYAGFIIGTLKTGDLINRIGHIRAFAAFCAVANASVMGFTFITDPVVWVILRAMIGFNMAGMFIVVESWLNVKATNANRGTLLSFYMVTTYLALGLGQFLINFNASNSQTPFILTSLLLSLAVVPVAITRASHPEPVAVVHFGLRRLYQISPLAVIGCIAAGLTIGALYALAPIFALKNQLSTGEVSLFMGVLISSGLLLQVPLGRLSDRMDRRVIIALASAGVTLISIFFVMWQQISFMQLLLLAALLGGFITTLYPLSIAYANDSLQPSEFVQASSGLLLTFGVGGMLGSLIAAVMMRLLGSEGLFIFTGVVNLLLTAFVLYRIPLRASVPQEQKEAFVPLPEVSVTPLAHEADPRAEGTQDGLFDTNHSHTQEAA